MFLAIVIITLGLVAFYGGVATGVSHEKNPLNGCVAAILIAVGVIFVAIGVIFAGCAVNPGPPGHL
jgi:hypothetical protein